LLEFNSGTVALGEPDEMASAGRFSGSECPPGFGVRHHDNLRMRRISSRYPHLSSERIELPPAVGVTVGGEQHLRLNAGKRSSTPFTPKSGEQDDQMAPILVAASMAIMVSGMLGMKPTTRSPGSRLLAEHGRSGERDLLVQLRVRHLDGLDHRLALEDDRGVVVTKTKEVLGEICREPGA
jgi:hypothetical protein